MKCENCKTDFDGPNFGMLDNSGKIARALDLCSRSCRTELRNARARDLAAKMEKESARIARINSAGSRNAEKGVAIATPKKALTAAQIKKKMRPSEQQISKAIGSEFTDRGKWNTRIQSGAIQTAGGHVVQLAKAGTPDRIAAAGLTIWIEVKKPGEVARPDQLETIGLLQAAGALAFVLDDPTDCDFIFAELEKSRPTIEMLNMYVAQIQQKIDCAIATNRDRRNS